MRLKSDQDRSIFRRNQDGIASHQRPDSRHIKKMTFATLPRRAGRLEVSDAQDPTRDAKALFTDSEKSSAISNLRSEASVDPGPILTNAPKAILSNSGGQCGQHLCIAS